MIFSKSVEYALKSIIYINNNYINKSIKPENISLELNLPKAYISKLLQNVVKSGILVSSKGKNGGFIPGNNDLLVSDLINSIEGCDKRDNCIMGISKCGDENPCPMHQYFKPIKEKLISDVLNRKISDIIKMDEKMTLI